MTNLDVKSSAAALAALLLLFGCDERRTEEDAGRDAGAVTMDGVFRNLVRASGISIVDAAIMCATTPARQLGLSGMGALTPGGVADLVVLDGALSVVRTYVGGQLAYQRST